MKKYLLLFLLLPCLAYSQHGVVTILKDLNSIELCHGTMGFRDSSRVINVEASTWTHITNQWNTLFETLQTGAKNVTKDLDKLIISKNGVYHCDFRVSISTANDKDFNLSVAKNTVSNLCGCIKFETKSTVATYSSFGEIIITDAPDTVFAVMKNNDDATDPTVYCGAVRIYRVRPQ